MADLLSRGETPGACASKDSCEAYCREESHREACVAFAEKVGLVRPEEAERIRGSRVAGPGGCTSRESCDTYCNEESHREECFAFAEDRGLIKKEDLEKTREGLIRIRAGFEDAPDAVRECIRATAGGDAIEDIQEGKLIPRPEIAEHIKVCFEKFGASTAPRQIFQKISGDGEIRSCMKEVLGDAFAEIETGRSAVTPEMADTMRICSERIQRARGKMMEGAQGVRLEGMPSLVEECVNLENKDECLRRIKEQKIQFLGPPIREKGDGQECVGVSKEECEKQKQESLRKQRIEFLGPPMKEKGNGQESKIERNIDELKRRAIEGGEFGAPPTPDGQGGNVLWVVGQLLGME